MKLKSATAAFMLFSAAAFPLQTSQADTLQNDAVEPMTTQKEFLQIHSRMQTNAGQYADNIFLAYIRSASSSNNTLAERGLSALAVESHRRTSIEPAGVVGLDIETDDLSLFPFILFQITDDTPRLSEQARLKVQSYLANGGEIAFDVLDNRVNNSQPLKTMLNDLQISKPEILQEGHALTQSFYLTATLPGVQDRPVWVESDNPALGERSSTSVIIGSNNWAGAWSSILTDPEASEKAIRAGLNMLSFSLTGNYKTDPVNEETIKMKRQYQREAEAREAARIVPEQG
ncbi:MAG: hypothetical protein CMH27_08570 [Micavibrio sp.]|nr:hypothetical protein [Micavibrio sp.]|tara:strand:+ start:2591 stop:3454 length:864 start_codon:yes stop_codon:yes gene_type:complete